MLVMNMTKERIFISIFLTYKITIKLTDVYMNVKWNNTDSAQHDTGTLGNQTRHVQLKTWNYLQQYRHCDIQKSSFHESVGGLNTRALGTHCARMQCYSTVL